MHSFLVLEVKFPSLYVFNLVECFVCLELKGFVLSNMGATTKSHRANGKYKGPGSVEKYGHQRQTA